MLDVVFQRPQNGTFVSFISFVSSSCPNLVASKHGVWRFSINFLCCYFQLERLAVSSLDGSAVSTLVEGV